MVNDGGATAPELIRSCQAGAEETTTGDETRGPRSDTNRDTTSKQEECDGDHGSGGPGRRCAPRRGGSVGRRGCGGGSARPGAGPASSLAGRRSTRCPSSAAMDPGSAQSGVGKSSARRRLTNLGQRLGHLDPAPVEVDAPGAQPLDLPRQQPAVGNQAVGHLKGSETGGAGSATAAVIPTRRPVGNRPRPTA